MFKILFIALISFQAHAQMREGIDKFHLSLSQRILRFAESIDNFFGDEEFADKGSTVSLTQSINKTEGEDLIQETRVRARLVFPNLKRKLRLNLRQNQETNVTQKDNLINGSTRQRESYSAGLDYLMNAGVGWKTSLETGILVRSPPDPYVRTRLFNTYKMDELTMAIQLKIFQYNNSGAGSTLDVNFSKPLKRFFFSYQNIVSWFDSEDEVEFITGPSLFKQLTKRRTIQFNLRAISTNKPTEMLDSYLFYINYRQRIHKNWLFAELVPASEFARENSWREKLSLTFRVEVLFGDVF